MDAFLLALDALPRGYGAGLYGGRRYGVTREASADGRRLWLYGEELGGPDRVSLNLYRLAGGRPALRPCEMSTEKVIDFVLGFRADERVGGRAPRSAAKGPRAAPLENAGPRHTSGETPLTRLRAS